LRESQAKSKFSQYKYREYVGVRQLRSVQTFKIITMPITKTRKLNVLPVKVQGESNLMVHADPPNVKNAREQVFVKIDISLKPQ
jgi:hypothetical protein